MINQNIYRFTGKFITSPAARSVSLWLAGAVFLLSTAVPAIVLAIALREPRSLAIFWAETGGGVDLLRSLALAGVVALLASFLAALTSAAMSGNRRSTAAILIEVTIYRGEHPTQKRISFPILLNTGNSIVG